MPVREAVREKAVRREGAVVRDDAKAKKVEKDFRDKDKDKDGKKVDDGWKAKQVKRNGADAARPDFDPAAKGAPKGKIDLDAKAPAKKPTAADVSKALTALSTGTLKGPGSAKTMDLLEAALADPSAKIVDKKNLGGGVNGTFIVTLSNGVKAVWKPSANEDMSKLRNQLEEDHQARREAAAYLIDKAMGHIAGAPPTVQRKLGGEDGALMAFVGDAMTANQRAVPAGKDNDQLALFDNVIGNTDRHTGNLLVTNNGKLVPIDHGLAFPLQNNNQGYHNFYFSQTVKLDAGQKAALKGLIDQRASLTKDMKKLGLDAQAINAMFDRIQLMQKAGTTVGTWQ
jgi:hypothetical protein